MSIPFSNTNYRIPQGFANLLEGLTREVLREQPQDIPLFAAKYFAGILKKKEESGFDPAEWGAALEDRYYNNHSFQHAEDTTYTSHIEDGRDAGEDFSVLNSVADIQQPQDVTSSVPLSEEEHEHAEDTTYTSHIEDGRDAGEDFSVLNSVADIQQPQDVTSSVPLSEEEHEHAEDTTYTSHIEDGGDTGEDFSVLNSVEDIQQPQDVTSSVPLSEEEHEHTEDNAFTSHIEDGRDGGEDVSVLNSVADIQPPGELTSPVPLPEEEHEDDTNETQVQAATVIQAALRGHLARGEVEKLREQSRENHVRKEKSLFSLSEQSDDTEKHGAEAEAEEPGATEPPSVGEDPDRSLEQEPQTHEADLAVEQDEVLGVQGNETLAEQPVTEETDDKTAEPSAESAGDQTDSDQSEACRKQPEEALDIDLDDPDANAAAAKIQAGFRGHMTRKKMKSGDKDLKHKDDKDGSATGEHEGD
ncbi:uncharacterized protein LOC134966751 [Pseudophryne corroboree]|uniref:uncharacterized protein LOC134966751 n=1 Tax=Pseudophryne corroboree TaxID=495146 RepID=UPI00308186AA